MINCENEWGTLELEGIGAAEVEVFSENKGYGNGSIITGKRAAAREITIHCKARPGIYSVEESRQRIVGFFASEYTYNVLITLYGTKRKTPVPCELVSIDIPTPSKLRSKTAEWTVTLLCPEPYLSGVENVARSIGEVVPAWGFPVMHTKGTTKYTTGYFKLGEVRDVFYNGTAPTPITLSMMATKAAQSLNITLDRADGKTVTFTINDTIAQSDVFYIDVRTSTVTKNDFPVSVEKYLSSVGSLKELMLTYGDNSFLFLDQNNEPAFDGSISYFAEYNGV